MYLGAHESIAGGLHRAFSRGLEDGCECIQIFTKNANQWQARPLDDAAIEAFRSRREELEVPFVSVHDSYLINLAQPDRGKWERAVEAFRVEMERATQLGCDHLIFHPGAHLGSGERRGIERIAGALSIVLEGHEGCQLLLETTAGQGSVLGYDFAQLRDIIDLVGAGDALGVCYDTCHTFAAGYDIRTPEAYERTFGTFEGIVGLRRLRAFHLNDSMRPFASRKDRHEQIGRGEIGVEAFRILVNDPRFRDLPGYLETPPLEDGDRGYRQNLDLLRSLRGT